MENAPGLAAARRSTSRPATAAPHLTRKPPVWPGKASLSSRMAPALGLASGCRGRRSAA